VASICRVEAGLGHQVGEQPGVYAFGPAKAALVAVEYDEGRLGGAFQARDDPGLRVDLLELLKFSPG
jgi:hypothetical protein